jgi:hypothetical protein
LLNRGTRGIKFGSDEYAAMMIDDDLNQPQRTNKLLLVRIESNQIEGIEQEGARILLDLVYQVGSYLDTLTLFGVVYANIHGLCFPSPFVHAACWGFTKKKKRNLFATMTTTSPLKSIIAPSLLSADLANLDKDAQQMMDM